MTIGTVYCTTIYPAGLARPGLTGLPAGQGAQPPGSTAVSGSTTAQVLTRTAADATEPQQYGTETMLSLRFQAQTFEYCFAVRC